MFDTKNNDYLLTALYEQHQMTNKLAYKGWSLSKNHQNLIKQPKTYKQIE